MRGEGMALFVPPRFEFVENDGRHHLLTSATTYDIIVNDEAIYAWYLELSTREFNELARSRLKPEGIYTGRLHNWRVTEEALRREFATFLEVFPNAAYWGISEDIGMLVGRNGDLPVDGSADPTARIPGTLWYDAQQLAALSEGYEVITDAHPLHIPDTFLSKDRYPLLEYTSPRSIPEDEGVNVPSNEADRGQPRAPGYRGRPMGGRSSPNGGRSGEDFAAPMPLPD